ncbi:MAG: hypothetical protein WBE80_07880 [Methylocella sp.]
MIECRIVKIVPALAAVELDASAAARAAAPVVVAVVWASWPTAHLTTMFSTTSMNFTAMSSAIDLKALLKFVVPVIRPLSCELKLVVIVSAKFCQLAVSPASES